MGILEFEEHNAQIVISSHIIIYGNAANDALSKLIRDEIELMWNEPQGVIRIFGNDALVRFNISSEYRPEIDPDEIVENLEPKNNYFRIEEFAMDNISFVDGLGSNTGYFLLENLYPGSTTAAHEYGHTLGLKHPIDLDYRGRGIPGIMYPRGTLVDAMYQYNPEGAAGDSNNGGTMHPMHRRVRQEDINLLKIERLSFEQHTATLGEFTSVWHPNHADYQEEN